MFTQFDEETDILLNVMERDLKTTLEQLENLETLKTALWEKIFQAFDQHMPGRTARFICDDEWVLSREIATIKPTVDAEKLKAAIYEVYPKKQADRVWNKITEPTRILDQSKLARAIETEYLPAILVDSSLAPARETVRRVRRQATKLDREAIKLNGVAKEETASQTA